MMESWAKCPTLYYIRHILGLSKRVTEAGPLEFGGLMHDGLAEYYRGLVKHGDWRQALTEALTLMAKQTYKDPLTGHRSKGRALLVMEQYAEHYKDDDLFTVLVNETAFDIEDKNGFRYGGRLDLGVDFRTKLWPLDHKTSSYFGDTYFDQFHLSPQMVGYTWAESELSGELPPGILINNITIRKNGSTEFHRQPILINPAHVAQWYEDTIIRYHQIQQARETGVYERRWYNCIDKWGPCDAYNVCHRLPENAARALEIEFEHDPWHWTKENKPNEEPITDEVR